MSATNLNANTVPCGGEDNEDDGCQKTFPRGTTRLCRKCKKLSEPSLSDADIERNVAMTQCGECGVFGTRVTDPCGTCMSKAHKENNVDQDSGKARRYDTIQSRVGRERQNTLNSVTQNGKIGATTPVTELENIRSSKATWTVCYEVRTSADRAKSVNKELGSGSLTFSGDQTMPGKFQILKALTYQISPQWTQRLNHLFELHVSDCELQFRDNKPFKRGTESLTLQKLYDHYSKGADRGFFLADHKGTVKLTKGSYVCLEVFINIDKYVARTREGLDYDDDGPVSSTVRTTRKSKPGGARGGRAALGPVRMSKRLRGECHHTRETLLQSKFVDSDLVSTFTPVAELPGTEVSFKKTMCVVDDVSRLPNLSEPLDIITGILSMNTLTLSVADQGKSKDVYKLTIAGQAYVAKRLRKGDNLDHNRLVFELACVKRLKSFVCEFFEHVQQQGLEIEEFTTTDVFVISLQTVSRDHVVHKVGAVYLVEPLRTSTSTIKITGTLNNREALGRRDAAVMAFAHWVLQNTAGKFVFADLQGNVDVVNEHGILTLFDPQSHSISGCSGQGDHGPDGIRAFLRTHQCTSICVLLQLRTMQQLETSFGHALEDFETQMDEEAQTPLKDGEYFEDRINGHDGLQRGPILILAP